MPKVSLTDLVLQNLKTPERGQTDYWDASLSGFGVRVSKGGSKTFVALVHRNGKRLVDTRRCRLRTPGMKQSV